MTKRTRIPSGTLYGLGVGPGDPELITVKARRILESVRVVAYPAPEEGSSVARAIADAHVPKGRTEIPIRMAMTPGNFPDAQVYDRAAAEIGGHLNEGRDVAVLCEGDPFLYGSFMYLHARMAEDFPVVVVPGVSSLAACAAAAGRPLVSRNQVLTVVPAPLSEDALARRLANVDAAAIMKVGKHLPKVCRVLARLGLADGARYVARVGMEDERICDLADVAGDAAPYFSMILVRRDADVSAAQDLPGGAAVVALGESGLELAQALKKHLPDAEVHGLAGRVAGADGADVTFADVGAHLRGLFAAGRPIVGVCAAGILVRALSPLLKDKRAEPPVIAVADDGSSFVPLLGGHSGANRLAKGLAAAVGGVAAITTAGEVRLGVALDDPPAGWRVANPDAAKGVMAALLAGRPVKLRLDADDGGWLSQTPIAFAEESDLAIRVTDRVIGAPGDDLIIHSPVLVLGLGCERGADAADAIALTEKTLAENGLSKDAVACVASLDLKADEDAVLAVAERLGVPARFFAAAELEAETPRLANPSDIVFRAVGCHGVAEGAALAAAGPDATLVVGKRAAGRVTVAVARAIRPIAAANVGRPRGTLALVGIGPGQAAWRTAEATAALKGAEHVVGYRLYLDLVADLVAGKTVHASELTEEDSRARLALDLAAEGKRVALVGSGDAGIYGLASLVFELIDREGNDAWRRVAVTVAPGVSALQAAAARLGAPLGHDFCAVSLSDLLTPWEDIEKRLEAAAAGDFVVALYNPVSKRRRAQLARAREILMRARPPATPVALARNLGRDGETVRVVTLAELSPDMADMLTVVLVGSSRTRVFESGGGPRLYTPRGYDVPRPKPEPTPPKQPLRLRRLEGRRPMTVHFIGAGPGAADLITVRGLDLVRASPVVLYAGSLVPKAIVAEAPQGARVVDTAPLTLDEIISEMQTADAAGLDVARVHSGDPSLYGAIAEQMRRLDDLGISYDVTPGVPAYAAAAAALKKELTLPDVTQTIVLTRTSVRSSGMPPGEELSRFAESQATLAIHLSINNLARVVADLAPHYGADCPVVVACRVSWPDEVMIAGTLSDIREKVKAAGVTRTALILVGRALGAGDFADSRLYAAGHHHVLRPRRQS